jgi:hypothetical protein
LNGPFSRAFDERYACRRAAHVGKEADEADNGLEVTQLEEASASDKHLVGPPIGCHGPDNPSAVPAVVALLCTLLADHFDDVALGQEAT